MVWVRVKTALCLLLPVLLLLLWGPVPRLFLGLLLFGAINWEFISLGHRYSNIERAVYLFSATLLPLGYLLASTSGIFPALVTAVLFLGAYEVVRGEALTHEDLTGDYLQWAGLGLCYTGGLGTALVAVCYERSAAELCTVLLTVIAADTFAFFGGRTIGGLKLAPRVSPGKTVSGAVCGLAGAVGVFLALVSYLAVPLSTTVAALFGLLIGIAALFGDLTESLLKRIRGVKDSGHLLPGHGGMLDRVDALLFAVPILLLLARVLP